MNNEKVYLLTTIDNPFSPFDEFENWYKFDELLGYNTCSYLARLTYNDDSLTSIEEKKNIEYAMNQMIENDFLGIYKKVTKNDYIKSENDNGIVIVAD